MAEEFGNVFKERIKFMMITNPDWFHDNRRSWCLPTLWIQQWYFDFLCMFDPKTKLYYSNVNQHIFRFLLCLLHPFSPLCTLSLYSQNLWIVELSISSSLMFKKEIPSTNPIYLLYRLQICNFYTNQLHIILIFSF